MWKLALGSGSWVGGIEIETFDELCFKKIYVLKSLNLRIFWTETPYDQIVFSCNTTSCEQLYNQVPADTSRGYEMSHT